MIGELRNIFEKLIAEFKQLIDDRFGVLQRQQNKFLQFIMEYAVSSAQTDDVSKINITKKKMHIYLIWYIRGATIK